MPIRIGDKQRISDDVEAFQLENFLDEHDIDQNLLLDCANLVCGTTIGILQHPKFKERNKNWRNTPIIPEFDYLIIDESSKTTFQEFLIPALYAKKWVLVGDVMQLSPFTDREEVVSNISRLPLGKNKTLPLALQEAIFYIQKLQSCFYDYKGHALRHNKFVLPVDERVLKYIREEIQLREDSQLNRIAITYIDKRKIKAVSKLELACCDLIIIEKNLLEENINKIPESHAVLRSQKWQSTEHAFKHSIYKDKCRFQYRDRGREFNNSFEITEALNAYFIEKSWAEEIAWRIDREHQLRMIDNSKLKERYSKTVAEFMPCSLDKETVEEQINNIAVMAFPSILESLVIGIKGRKTKVKSTVSEGFKKEDIEQRRTILQYQHRMHPEISQFPRKQFYKNGALQDLQSPQPIEDMRAWAYGKFDTRSVWIDVKGKTERNRNTAEVKALIRQLKEFIAYAKNHPQPEGKEWAIACLSFYRGQETLLREQLQKLTKNENAFSNFYVKDGQYPINIKLHTVDKFQGQEADVVFLSMVQTHRDGFLDNPNRLNVAITRAKFQLVIVGDHGYFKNKSRSIDLKHLANATKRV